MTPDSPLSLPPALLARAAAAFNHLLTQQPQAAAQLQPHAGKRLRLELAALAAEFEVGADGQLLASGPAAAAPDLRLQIDGNDMLAGAIAGQGLGMRGVSIAGDAEFAHAISWLLKHLRWDAEDDLARVVGDIAAHRLARAAAGLREQGGRWFEQIGQDARDWLAEAPRALVTRAELAPLAAQVAQLRDATARLDKRIALLARRS